MSILSPFTGRLVYVESGICSNSRKVQDCYSILYDEGQRVGGFGPSHKPSPNSVSGPAPNNTCLKLFGDSDSGQCVFDGPFGRGSMRSRAWVYEDKHSLVYIGECRVLLACWDSFEEVTLHYARLWQWVASRRGMNTE